MLATKANESDEALAACAREGMRSAFAVLVARYQDSMYRLALRMSRNASDAEEITQETFLLAHRGIASFHGDARFRTWLYRIAVNQALMHRRRARRRPLELFEPQHAVDAAEDPAEPVDALIDRKNLVGRVQAALGSLDASHRAALVLRDLEQLSSEEAAEVLGISPEAVRQRAHRARLRLRELLDVTGDPATRA